MGFAKTNPGAAAWFTAIDAAESGALVAAIGGLGGTGATHTEPYREAARAMLEQKLAEAGIAQMARLEKASQRLGLFAVGAGVIVGVAEILASVQ